MQVCILHYIFICIALLVAVLGHETANLGSFDHSLVLFHAHSGMFYLPLLVLSNFNPKRGHEKTRAGFQHTMCPKNHIHDWACPAVVVFSCTAKITSCCLYCIVERTKRSEARTGQKNGILTSPIFNTIILILRSCFATRSA